MLLVIFLLTASLVLGANEQDEQAPAAKRQIIDAAWQNFQNLFYDPDFRGVDWNEVHREYQHRVDQVQTRQQLADLIREMVATLHNSHSGFMTNEEWRRTRNILPFFFDSISGHVFVSYVFQARESGPEIPLQFGDEILTVDGLPSTEMKPPTVFWVDPVMTNPYYGPAKSIAKLTIRRGTLVQKVEVTRVQRFADVVPVVYRKLDSRVAYLRFLKMDQNTISLSALRSILEEALTSDALVIDVRHCVGGDTPVMALVGGMLLGPGVEVGKTIRRGESPSDKNARTERTSDFGAVYKGKVALLTDSNTESEPELLAAALQELGRAQIIGLRTRGALNGDMEGIDLPSNFGILVVPIDRGISPHGKEYEGIGVAPDVPSENSPADFQIGRDAVIETARHSLGR